MPECFSRPICRFALSLNDQANDQERQRLLPYVTRLACADTREVEKARADYIHRHTRGYPHTHIPFDKGLEVLEGALAIGRHADPLGPEEVQSRMDAVRAPSKQKAAWRASKIKNWLSMKQTEPTA